MPEPMMPWRARLLWNYTPVLHTMPPPEIDSAIEEPAVCFTISAKLVPYLLGLLEIYRWPDKFSGTPEDKERAVGVFQDLMTIIATASGVCVSDPCCPETNELLQQILDALSDLNGNTTINNNNTVINTYQQWVTANQQLAQQLELLDDGTPQSFAPGAPDEFTEGDILCGAVDKFFELMMTGIQAEVAIYLYAAGLLATGATLLATLVASLLGTIVGTVLGTITVGAITVSLQNTLANPTARQKVKCCLYDGIKGRPVSAETLASAVSDCGFSDFTDEAVIARWLFAFLNRPENYRAFVRLLTQTNSGSEADCQCCDDGEPEALPGRYFNADSEPADVESLGNGRWRVTSKLTNVPNPDGVFPICSIAVLQICGGGSARVQNVVWDFSGWGENVIPSFADHAVFTGDNFEGRVGVANGGAPDPDLPIKSWVMITCGIEAGLPTFTVEFDLV